MNRQCAFSNVTQEYLSSFRCILDEMIQGMTEAELTDSISHNFIVQMIPHHQAAIDMSRNILKYTTNIPVQNIATQIIEEQTKSIENMREIQCACSELTNCEQDLCRYQNQVEKIMRTMFWEMGGARATNGINCNFMREMIPHHQGAIKMSNNALQFPICPSLKPILQAIITSQQKGVQQMRHLLRCTGC